MNGDVITMHPDAKEVQRLEKLAADQRAAILNAITALEEGRRGDAMGALKTARNLVQLVPASTPPEAGAVA